MKDVSKKDVLLIINTYQNHINDFVNVSDKALDAIYLEVAKKDFENLFF